MTHIHENSRHPTKTQRTERKSMEEENLPGCQPRCQARQQRRPIDNNAGSAGWRHKRVYTAGTASKGLGVGLLGVLRENIYQWGDAVAWNNGTDDAQIILSLEAHHLQFGGVVVAMD